jgi:hypothetical protein
VLGQLGESRLDAAILADIAGEPCHARALDADTKGALRDIHWRVGAAILFESSGGQIDKVAHLPELRFALGEPPEVDTATIDTAAAKLEAASFFIRKVGTDGYRIHHQATLKKVVSDRRASLDEETEIKPAIRKLVESEFERGASIPVVCSPVDSMAIQDAPRLRLVVADPEIEWNANGAVADRVVQWTRDRGSSPRLYPAALIWCLRKPGRELRDAVEHMLAWRRVAKELHEGLLGAEYDRAERVEVQTEVRTAEDAAKDQVWSGYRFVVVSDAKTLSGLKVIDLGAGHASASETLCGRIIGALKNEGLLNEGIGAGYLDRHWPPAFKEGGAWPLASLRQSFLNGTLTRLIDPDTVLRTRIAEFVSVGEFGLASGAEPGGNYRRVWFQEDAGPAEIAFEADVYLLTKALAEKLKSPEIAPVPQGEPEPAPPEPSATPETRRPDDGVIGHAIVSVAGSIPPEQWNRLGTRLLPKMRAAGAVTAEIRLEIRMDQTKAASLSTELRQIVEETGLSSSVRVDQHSAA